MSIAVGMIETLGWSPSLSSSRYRKCN